MEGTGHYCRNRARERGLRGSATRCARTVDFESARAPASFGGRGAGNAPVGERIGLDPRHRDRLAAVEADAVGAVLDWLSAFAIIWSPVRSDCSTLGWRPHAGVNSNRGVSLEEIDLEGSVLDDYSAPRSADERVFFSAPTTSPNNPTAPSATSSVETARAFRKASCLVDVIESGEHDR